MLTKIRIITILKSEITAIDEENQKNKNKMYILIAN